MSNDFFQFKHFIVKQSSSGMKVGTDSCLLGSWVNVENCRRILDIGTGTGVLALMCAQKLERFSSVFEIDAVDIEQNAVEQAKENVLASPWSGHIRVFCMDILNYESIEKYDLIVCNPPFFEDSLKSFGEQRTLARHNITLNFFGLIKKVSDLISLEGIFCVVLPINVSEHFIHMALEKQLYLNHRTDVYTIDKKPPKRALLSFSKRINSNPRIDRLIIQSDGEYTHDYKELLKDFDLRL